MKNAVTAPKSKHAWLLKDDGVKRWIKNLERVSIKI